METYSKFRPTQYDHHITVDEQENWLVAPVSTNRDADMLAESNWETFLAGLKKFKAYEDYQVHNFGHWGPGWFEIVLLNPENKKLIAYAESVELALAKYPLLDEADYSNRQWEYCAQYISDNFPELSEAECSLVMSSLPEISENICYEDVESVVTDLGLNAKEITESLLIELAEHPYQALHVELDLDKIVPSHLKKINEAISKFLSEHSEHIPTLRDTDELNKLERVIADYSSGLQSLAKVMHDYIQNAKQLTLL